MISLIDFAGTDAIHWRRLPCFGFEIAPTEGPFAGRRFGVNVFSATHRGLELTKELWIDREGHILRTTLDVFNPDTAQLLSITTGVCATGFEPWQTDESTEEAQA